MTLPPHIANAPTPRTDESVLLDGAGIMLEPTVVLASDMRQLERELIYAREVMEKVVERLRDSDKSLDPTYKIEHRCNVEALAAYEQFKKDTEQ